ncbi:uncharacterized protein LOC107370980 [Tetranychus urticae]|uniref:BACK domain-containing protein n=1 Tax=Tetranychus urticae TaxID=32264 RepID=T1JYA7_TETUR|nr:uncharacterized protein LOC107370980 [Tetranychus urticae]
MNSLETDDQLTIVNRSMRHLISKKLIRKVPYFEKLLSHDLLESKENKVVLDFDERAFKMFLNWIESDYMLIQMPYVIYLCNILDYFGLDNNLIDDYTTYFHDNFSTRHLPAVIPQVTPTSKCINSGALNAFICRHFLKIVGTKVWLNYPIETIEYICALDLMVHSEMQVFNAIMKWVNFKPDSRKDYLKKLLKLIRWCHLDDKDLYEIKENDLIKSANVFCTPVEGNGYCTINRIDQYYFVLVEELDGTDLEIKVLDRNFMSFIKQVIKLDVSLPLNLLHNEHVSDIVFDSGRQMIRVDWNQNKYRLIDLIDYKSHHYKIHKCILEKNDEKCYNLESDSRLDYTRVKGSLLEFSESFFLIADKFIRYTGPMQDLNYCCWTTPTVETIENCLQNSDRNGLVTVLDSNIYIMNTRYELIKFNIDSQEIKRFTNKINLGSGDLILTSMPVHDDKVFLIDRYKKVVECFNVNDEEWTPFGLMSNNCSSTGDQRKSNKMVAFTSTFLWSKIRSYISRERKLVE